MPTSIRAIPQGHHSLTPSLTCKNASAAIDFYKKVFGAEEIMRMEGPGGMIGHAELKFGDSLIHLNDEFPGMASAPVPGVASAIQIFHYTEDVDAVFNRAVAEGCQVTMPLQNQFWGDRYGKLIDPFGHPWGLAQHVEDVAPQEMQRRAEEWQAQMSKSQASPSSTKSAGQN